MQDFEFFVPIHYWGITYAIQMFWPFLAVKIDKPTVPIISVPSTVWPYLWNISYVSKMYRDEKFEILHIMALTFFWLLVHHWNFYSFLSHPTAPFLPIHLSLICLRSHVGVREADFVILADLSFLGCGAPTCDWRQISDKWTGKNGAARCDKKL